MAKKQTTLKVPHSITISGSASNISITSSAGATIISTQKTKYHVLGEDVEVSSNGYYRDSNLVTTISTLNILGKPFWDELHKNGVFFPQEIEEYLEKKFKYIERDNKINSIIN